MINLDVSTNETSCQMIRILFIVLNHFEVISLEDYCEFCILLSKERYKMREWFELVKLYISNELKSKVKRDMKDETVEMLIIIWRK